MAKKSTYQYAAQREAGLVWLRIHKASRVVHVALANCRCYKNAADAIREHGKLFVSIPRPQEKAQAPELTTEEPSETPTYPITYSDPPDDAVKPEEETQPNTRSNRTRNNRNRQ